MKFKKYVIRKLCHFRNSFKILLTNQILIINLVILF